MLKKAFDYGQGDTDIEHASLICPRRTSDEIYFGTVAVEEIMINGSGMWNMKIENGNGNENRNWNLQSELSCMLH